VHIHGNQLDASLQVQALASAAKAEEKEEAERTRERLRKAAAALAEQDAAEDCVVRLSGDNASQEQLSQREQNPDEETESGGEVFSDWA
jgi:hypothetical protein